MQRLFMRRLPQFLIGLLVVTSALIFLSLRSTSHEIETTTWTKALIEGRQQLVQADQTREVVINRFSEENPVVTDWLRQDEPKNWENALEENVVADRARVVTVLEEIESRGGSTNAWNNELKEELSSDELIGIYMEVCNQRRTLRLEEFLSLNNSIVFAQHHNFKMSFIGYTEGLSDARHERFFKPGAKLVKLNFNGNYGEIEPLIDDPHGMIRDIDVSDDGNRIVYAWKKSDRLDDYHIYEYNLRTADVRQLTKGIGRADYEPIYVPGGDIIFASTRPEQSVPCWWTEISNLYRMNPQGDFLRRLAIDQVHTLYPQVLENGRIIYTRWDYSDRGQNYPHPIFSMNPDGTDQRAYYGANSWFPTSLLHARTIPGTDKVMAVAAGHHTRQHGKVVVLDVKEGRDEGKGMSFVAPKRDVPYERVDRAQQHGDQFRYPYPLNEREFLASYVPEEADANVPKYADDAVYGLYWMDVDGHRELLYLDKEISVGRPVPMNKPTEPIFIPDTVDYTQDKGYYYVHDVYQGVGLQGIPRGTAKKIRIVRLNYRAAGVGMSRNKGEGGGSLNSNPVSIGNGTWDIKEILGDVDIHADGSAMFEVPAMESIYLQVLDAEGRVIQTTRTWDTVRPGEKKACVGCHHKQDANFYPFVIENTLAWNQEPQKIQPFYGETRGFSFIKEIQPILDAKCITCHNGSQKGVMSLKGTMKSHGTLEKRTWSEAYLNLTHAYLEKDEKRNQTWYKGDPENEVVNWISKMSKPTELDPYSFGAKTSGMMHLLEAGHYNVDLTTEEYHKFAAWLDLLVPFVGEYREANAWSPEEMAFYNYYEHKRGLHKKEEIAEIKNWVDAQQKGTVSQASSKQSNIGAGYRTLLSQRSEREGKYLYQFDHPVMIDRLDFERSDKTPMTYSIAFEEKTTLDTTLQSSYLVLPAPLRASSLQIEGPDGWDGNVMFMGVLLRELPSFDSHHPYLQLSSPD